MADLVQPQSASIPPEEKSLNPRQQVEDSSIIKIEEKSELRAYHGLPGPGRPKGRKNNRTLQQREVAEMVLGKPGTSEFEEFVKSQRMQLLAGILPPAIIQLWMHYLVGKPKETIELQGEVVIEKIVREIVRPSDVQVSVEPVADKHVADVIDAIH